MYFRLRLCCPLRGLWKGFVNKNASSATAVGSFSALISTISRFAANKRVVIIVKLALTALFVHFANRRLSLGALRELAGEVSAAGAFIAALLGLIGLALQVARWRIILRYEELPSSWALSWKTMLFGNLLAFVTPGRIGELFRGAGLSAERKADTIFAVLIDKLFTIAATLTLGAACLAVQVTAYGVMPYRALLWILGAAFACGMAGIAAFIHGGPIRSRPVLNAYRRRMLRMVPRAFSPAGKKAIAFSLTAQLILLIQTALLMNMFGGVYFLSGLIAAGQAYALMVFLPFAIANMGVREYTFGLFLAGLHLSGIERPLMETALGASAAILLINIVAPALAGLVWNLASFNGKRN